jgi:hypothetical protein
MTLPNFFFVGASKSGTTSIFDALTQHPDIYMSAIKAPCYFSDDWPQWVSNLAQYEALFDDADQEAIIGEASDTYLNDPQTPARIQATIPHACRFLISLRNPVRRAFSQWEHLYYHEKHETLSFAEAIRTEEARTSDHETMRALPFYRPDLFKYYGQGLYAERIQRYYDAFGTDHVHVVIFEELIADPERELSAIYRFLDVDDTFQPDLQRKNSSRQSRFGGLHHFLQSPPQALVNLYEQLPPRVQQTIYRTARALYWANQTDREKERISPDLYATLMARYQPSIHELEQLLGRDLSIWYDEA